MIAHNLRRCWRSFTAVALSVVAASCADSNVVSPAFNATHNSIPAVGAVTWLTPLGTGYAGARTFDAKAVTRVEVCVWASGACSGGSVATFSTNGSGAGLLRINNYEGRYEAVLNLLDPAFTTRKSYRIRALNGTTEVGGFLIDIANGQYAFGRTDGIQNPLGAANDLNVQFHVALVPPPMIRINEVESNGGTPGDWVELFNAGETAVDISGYVFKDNDDTHAYKIPVGTVVPVGGYFVLEEAAFGFGLGGGESARLFTPSGEIADSYSWATHAATTYGRCKNGTGGFIAMPTVTKGAANACLTPNTVKINEVESNGGTPGDWVELYNSAAIPIDLSGWVLKDNDVSRGYVIPAGTVIQAGGYYVVEEAAMGFGLGAIDEGLLFDNTGGQRDWYSWSTHATTSYGRCANGVGAFITMTTVTKGTGNSCPVIGTLRINEAESNGGTPGDWVELKNIGTTTLDVSGFVFKDNDDTHVYIIPNNTTIAAGGYLVLDESQFVFGLGADETVRIFDQGGALIDSYAWTSHATSTYGRCPDGTGPFTTMTTVTKGAANDCNVPNTPSVEAWPGLDNVTTVDVTGTFSSNMSGLKFEAGATNVLWAARNGPGSIYRMIFNGTNWVADQANGWGSGKLTKFMDGTGEPDTEDLTYTTGSAAGMYIVSERNNSASGVSRPSVLRYDVTGTASTLVATNEWVLTGDLPVVAANSGLEAITWIPDSYLVAQGFFDVTKNHKYNPAEYPNGGGGLFFVGLEGNGVVYVYSLNHTDNTFTRITSFSTGFPSGVMALQFDLELGQLWAVCDDTCGGLSNIYVIDVAAGSATLGRMKLSHVFGRAPSMPNINNEGFTISPQSMCVNGMKPAFWSDDSSTGGNAIRRASIPCVKFP